MLKGRHKKFWGSFYAVAYSFSHIEVWGEGGRKKFPFFKRGGGRARTVLPCLEGGGGGVSDPRFSHFVAPRPVINDQSLISTSRVFTQYPFSLNYDYLISHSFPSLSLL